LSPFSTCTNNRHYKLGYLLGGTIPFYSSGFIFVPAQFSFNGIVNSILRNIDCYQRFFGAKFSLG
jgi:hypothetical protein